MSQNSFVNEWDISKALDISLSTFWGLWDIEVPTKKYNNILTIDDLSEGLVFEFDFTPVFNITGTSVESNVRSDISVASGFTLSDASLSLYDNRTITPYALQTLNITGDNLILLKSAFFLTGATINAVATALTYLESGTTLYSTLSWNTNPGWQENLNHLVDFDGNVSSNTIYLNISSSANYPDGTFIRTSDGYGIVSAGTQNLFLTSTNLLNSTGTSTGLTMSQSAITEALGFLAIGSYSDEQAQDAVGNILSSTSQVNLVYNDSVPSISAILNIAQVTGTSTVLPMSQSAITNAITTAVDNNTNALTLSGQSPSFYLDRLNHTGTQLSNTISDFSVSTSAITESVVNSYIVQTTGTSLTNLMSQSAITSAINTRAASAHTHTSSQITDFSASTSGVVNSYIVQSTGSSLTSLMSQSAITQAIQANSGSTNALTLSGQSPSFYLDRANHTGTQLSNTISDFSASTSAITESVVNSYIVQTTGTSLTNLMSQSAVTQAIQSISGVTTLSGLTDVVFPTPLAFGDIIQYSGTNWVNVSSAGGFLPIGSNIGSTIRWDGGSWVENSNISFDVVSQVITLTAGGNAIGGGIQLRDDASGIILTFSTANSPSPGTESSFSYVGENFLINATEFSIFSVPPVTQRTIPTSISDGFTKLQQYGWFGSGTIDLVASTTGTSTALTMSQSAITQAIQSISGSTDALTLSGQSPSFYLDRANHTGTQLSNTISDFSASTSAITESVVNSYIVQTTGTSLTSLMSQSAVTQAIQSISGGSSFTSSVAGEILRSDGLDFINNGASFRVSGSTLLITGDTGNPTTLPGGFDAGTRLMWYPAKGAFRAGTVDSSQWDDVNIGTNSVAFGQNNTASGIANMVVGADNIVSGSYSFVAGSSNIVPSPWSIVVGEGHLTTNIDAVALFNIGNTANADYVLVAGDGNTANHRSMLAFGAYSITPALQSSWEWTGQLLKIGNGLDDTTRSNALVVYKNSTIEIGHARDVTNNSSLADATFLTVGTTTNRLYRIGSDLYWSGNKLLDETVILQSTGTSTALTMSQSAITNAITTAVDNNTNALTLSGQSPSFYLDRANHTNTQLSNTISDFSASTSGVVNSYIVQSTGSSLTNLMSQSAITNAINTRAASVHTHTSSQITDFSASTSGVVNSYIVQSTGTSLTSFMSQSAVTQAIQANSITGSVVNSVLRYNGLTYIQTTTMAINSGGTASATGNSAVAWGNSSQANALQSTAWGFSTLANAAQSTAWGNSSQAIGIQSTAWGFMTRALTISDTAWGNMTTANGGASTAWGDEASATSTVSTAFGASTLASGIQSLAFGENTTASTSNATAFGLNTLASGIQSLAFGSSTRATASNSVAWGNGSIASGDTSTAFGFNNIAANLYSLVWGENNVSSGQRSTAFGVNSVASGNQSLAFGNNTVASALRSTAWGNATSATTLNSTAWGTNTLASGNRSTSFGDTTTASAYASTAFGLQTNANSYLETSIGSYSIIVPASSDTSWVWTDELFKIGNGIGTSDRSDAFIVYKNATIEIGPARDISNNTLLASATTSNVGTIANRLYNIQGNLYWNGSRLLNVSDISQSTGTSTGLTMSQSAITQALQSISDASSGSSVTIVQTTGTSTTSVMSQSATTNFIANTPRPFSSNVQALFDGSGSIIPTGLTTYVRVPYNCTLSHWQVFNPTGGTAQVDVWYSTSWPPTISDSITNTNYPTITSQQVNSGSTSSWTTTNLIQGAYLAFQTRSTINVDSLQVYLLFNTSI